MSKTKEELNAIKEEVEAVNEKLAELTEEEIAQVSSGVERPGSLTIAIQSLELRGVGFDSHKPGTGMATATVVD